jgi:tetratricopeptide (TPR) repeat protein
MVAKKELSDRIREALELRDWVRLEHWAKQWITLEPKAPNGFKWLARAAFAQKQIKRAAYAYGRLIDFEPNNVEAKDFFSRFPSTLDSQPASVAEKIESPASYDQNPESLMAAAPMGFSREKKELMSKKEFETAELYFSNKLYALSAERYRASYDWIATQAASMGFARSLSKVNKGAEATQHLRAQLFEYPDWNDGRMLLGRILLELGRKHEAQREWQIVLDRDPSHKEALESLKRLLSS